MTDKDALTPRVFIFRHGETEWSKSGRHTSFTDIDLTSAGITQVTSTAALLVGDGKLIDPRCLVHVFASPRKRARTTLEQLLPLSSSISAEEFTYTDDITEWNYGNYEGLKKHEVQGLRRSKGLDKSRDWDVWTDGCEGGESVQQVTDRLDKFISRIKDIQKPYMHGTRPADIVIVAHGLILRCLAKRWLGYGIPDHFPMMFEPGAVAILSYKNNNINEPAIHVGIALPPGK
ncbi:phosphoglycerate mutase-like protein [Myriangium duriaei CBS 260.36]|uniref:Phosphoglycerate mutase-like protein n=1 Tax=Myriangium duriaei CBS 260.36 TaxID=1168546 RepID=A0A9P4MJM1_9PEZI|nr:phosphoglycerate mutase-like protein [Myriangium duriaei CBS 260.36]